MNYSDVAPLAGPAAGGGLAFSGASTWIAVAVGVGILGAGLYTSTMANRRRRAETAELEEALRR